MAKKVPEGAEPVTTLPLTAGGLHLPRKYRDHDGGMVVRTRWETQDLKTDPRDPDDRNIWPLVSYRQIFVKPEDQGGYVQNPRISRGQVALLRYGDEVPDLFDVKPAVPCRCPKCDADFHAAMDFEAHWENHHGDGFEPSYVRTAEAVERFEDAALEADGGAVMLDGAGDI